MSRLSKSHHYDPNFQSLLFNIILYFSFVIIFTKQFSFFVLEKKKNPNMLKSELEQYKSV